LEILETFGIAIRFFLSANRNSSSMPFQVRNLADLKIKNPRLYETVIDLITGIENVANQTNANPNGVIPPPNAPQALTVLGGGGIFDAAITDNSANYRGQSYFLEYSANSGFNNPTVIHLGPARNWRGNLGNQTLFWRTYSSYPTSNPSGSVYHGGAMPESVSSSGTTEPIIQPSQGSGTNNMGGFGSVPYKGQLPPTR
jgi:hypothetical protein